MHKNTEITEDKTQEKLERQHYFSFTQTLKICANAVECIFFFKENETFHGTLNFLCLN